MIKFCFFNENEMMQCFGDYSSPNGSYPHVHAHVCCIVLLCTCKVGWYKNSSVPKCSYTFSPRVKQSMAKYTPINGKVNAPSKETSLTPAIFRMDS